MNKAEQQRRWDRFKLETKNCDFLVSANGIRVDMVRTAVKFGLEVGMPIAADPEDWDRQILSAKAIARSKRLIKAVENEILGLRFTKDDFDILAPPTMTDDEIAYYQQLGGWKILLAGVVIIAAAIAYTVWIRNENETLRNKFNNLLVATDEKFCKDPNSQICKSWIDRKRREQFEKKKSFIEKLEDGIIETGGVIKKGIGFGVAIAIAIFAWSLSQKLTKKSD